jgi:transposase
LKKNNTSSLAPAKQKRPAATKKTTVKTTARRTVGIDLGDKKSAYCILDAEGGVLCEGIVRTSESGFAEQFQYITPCRIALEAGTHSPWASRLLQSYGHDLIVANARRLRVIYDNDRKNDRVDARTLA